MRLSFEEYIIFVYFKLQCATIKWRMFFFFIGGQQVRIQFSRKSIVQKRLISRLGPGKIQWIPWSMGSEARLWFVHQLSKVHGEKPQRRFSSHRPKIVMGIMGSFARLYDHLDSKKPSILWFYRHCNAFANLFLSWCRWIHSIDQVKRKMSLLQRWSKTFFTFLTRKFLIHFFKPSD